MAERAPEGAWVEIHSIVLPADLRASHVPEDTRRVPLEMRVKGFLVEAAAIGEEVEVVTAAGRRLRGVLASLNPAYSHSFGPPIPELSTVGAKVRAMLRERGVSR
jgi:hypothetical protein